ncbi:MAG: DAK2 domain-containing protein [bacterium]|nr:DAK2 domain-containing protein [bacterium]
MDNLLYLDGNLYKNLMISGATNLEKNRIVVNNLNVFPIPDGDTGDNMSMTIGHGISEVSGFSDNNIGIMSKKISRGMLFGARGNSGVILSQIFRGVSDYLKDKEKANAIDLANAFISGTEKAYKMVVNPVEGTILTVVRKASNKAKSIVNDSTTIKEFFKVFLDEANITLKDTINMMECLKKANVIDSGGAGLVYIIEGMLKYFDSNINLGDYILDYKFERDKYVASLNSEMKDFAIVSVCNGDGLRDLFINAGADYIIDGGQTMNPSTEDFLRAFDLVNAKTIIVLPNNSNIILSAKQAKDIYDKSNVEIVESKTICEGLSAMAMANYDDPDFIGSMKEAVANVITGEVTYSIRDAVIDDVEIKKDDFIAIVDKKIVAKSTNKSDCLKELINYEISKNNKEMINVIYGKDVLEKDIEDTCNDIINNNKYVEVNYVSGAQDVYSFIVAFE